MPLSLSDIITELENIDLESSEIRNSADSYKAAVDYFFEQIAERPTWTREELHELRIGSQVAKAGEILGELLKPKRRRKPTA